MKFNKWYEFVEGKIGGAFAKYGRFVSRHAWKIIIVTIIVNGALGIGMINLQSDIETGNVYLPQGTHFMYFETCFVHLSVWCSLSSIHDQIYSIQVQYFFVLFRVILRLP
jgi:hypothetical protein